MRRDEERPSGSRTSSVTKKLILSLCDSTGNWPRPYTEDPAYKVVRVDLTKGNDVRLLRFSNVPVHGILAAPPCTHFCIGGAESWSRKGDEAVLQGLSVVDACLRIAAVLRPVWWALENPPGRLKDWIGLCAWTFHPCDFGGYLAPREKSLRCPLFPARDAYTKRTCIWGTARKPQPKPVAVAVPPRLENHGFRTPCFFRHVDHRSVTPLGFARAFKEANP